jgi:hypothetical protein
LTGCKEDASGNSDGQGFHNHALGVFKATKSLPI